MMDSYLVCLRGLEATLIRFRVGLGLKINPFRDSSITRILSHACTHTHTQYKSVN